MEAEANLTENYDYLFEVNPVYSLLALFSTCFFTVMFFVISPSWSDRRFPEYKSLSITVKADWNSRVGAIIHSLIVTPLALYVVFFDEEANNDPVWGNSVAARIAMATTWGFMFADLFIIWRYFSWKDIIIYSCHHIATLYPYGYNVLYGPMPLFGCFMLFTEGSTPFVNIRWFLHILKRSDSDLYLYNGLVMTVTFFLLRIVPIVPYWTKVYHVYSTHPMPGFDFRMRSSLIGASLALCCLNIFWFWKMLQGGRKVIQRRTKRVEAEANKDKGL